MKKMSLALFVLFWAVWFFFCRYYLIWLEGYSYFSTLPDYTSLFKSIPYGLSCYVGSFLHQFYIYPQRVRRSRRCSASCRSCVLQL